MPPSWLRPWASRYVPRPRRRVRPTVEALEERRVPTAMVYMVTTTANSGTGSLRQAILDANANAGTDTIAFDIGTGAQKISPTAALPAITDPVVLDATKQPGYAGTPLIELNGASAGAGVTGLTITGGGSTVLGLHIDHFAADGIDLTTNGGNTIQGDYLGGANGGNGILVTSGNNTIGGTAAGAGNVISGNTANGIDVGGTGATGNVVEGNDIGTLPGGAAALANGSNGVQLGSGAANNLVTDNVLSGNTGEGIKITGAGTSGNTVQGNLIGLNAAGSAALANTRHGIEIINSAAGNVVGPGNTISGNLLSGIYVNGAATTGNVIQGNVIGTNPAGTAVLGNGSQGALTLDEQGIKIESAANDTVGGTAAGAGNVIAGNAGDGVFLAAGTSGVVVQGNFIGTNAAGAANLKNGADGVLIDSSFANTVGGTAAGAGNVIAGNGGNGVTLLDHVPTTPPFHPGTNDSGGMTLTAAGAAAGFTLSTFADGFPNSGAGGIGPMGITFTNGGGVMVGDYHNGKVAVFATDTDNQHYSRASLSTSSYGADNAAGLATSGGNIYLAGQTSNVLAQVDQGGNFVQNIATGMPRATGVATNPNNGHLFVSTLSSGTIWDVDPVARTKTAFVNVGADGVTADSTALFAASGQHILGFHISNGQQFFDSGLIATADGATLGEGALAGYVFTDTNDGRVVMVSTADPTIRAVIASGGSRGDLLSVDPNGTILLTQTDRVERLTFSFKATTTNNVIQGNLIGTAGSTALPNTGDGIDVLGGAFNNTIGAGNVISGNAGNGVYISANASSGNVVQGSRIGTTASGLAALGNGKNGVFLDGAPDNTIGGTTAPVGNVITADGASGAYPGILIANGGATGNVVQGNLIGLGADGTTALPGPGSGVVLGSMADNNTVGGTTSGAGNRVGANGTAGQPGFVDSIVVDDWTGSTASGTPGVGNLIRQNSITDSPGGGNGIFLSAGANDGQAAPTLTAAFTSANLATVSGSLTGTAGTAYTVEFFASASGSPSEGQTFLGQEVVPVGTAGQASFTATGLLPVPAGQFVTATATSTTTNDTSSFSAALPVVVDNTAPTSTVAALPPFEPGSFTVSWSGSDNPGGSGIAAYDVFVSMDGGAFTPWRTGTTQTSGTYTGANGHTYGFYSVATDLVGNRQATPTSPQATTTVDTVPPTSSITALPPFTNTASFTVSWSGSDNPGGSGIASYDVFVSDNGGAYTAFQTATTQTSATFTGQDGHSYRFYSVATDNAGNRQAPPTSAQATTLVDTTPPTSSVSPLPAFTNNPNIALSWSGSDGSNGSGVATYDVFVIDNGGAPTAFLTGTTQTSATYTGTNGHTYAFTSVATDNAGNRQPTPTSPQATTLVDTVAPTSSVAALPAFSPTKFTVSWSGSDNPGGSGIATYDVFVSDNGATATAFLTGTTQTSATFTGQDGHTYGFTSVATDRAGNREAAPGTPEATTTVDTVPPTSSVAPLPAFENTAGFTVSWSGSDNTGGSGLATYDVFVIDNGGTPTAFLTATTQTSATFTGQDGHRYGFYSVATDNAGNRQATPTAPQATTLVDTVAPTSSVASLPAFTNNPNIALSWSGSDGNTGSGIATYNVFVSDDGGAPTAFLTATAQTSATFTGQDGHTYGFFSVATDNAGNRQPTPTSPQATTLVDTVPPTSSVAALPAFENTASFTVSWSGSDNPGGSGLATYDVFVSDNGGAPTALLTGTTQTSATFTGKDGHSYRFTSIATDNAGNRQPAPVSPQTTRVDTTPPTSTVAALPAFEPAGFTVTWSGSDGTSGSGVATYDVFVSDNGGAPTAFLTATTQTSATFTGTNGHTYGFFSVATDNAGNRQPTPTAPQATTTVDTTPPTSTVTVLPATTTAASFLVSWSGSDGSGPGIASFDIYVSDNGSAFVPWLTGTTDTSATYTGLPGHSYGFYSIAVDAVGNRQAAPTSAQASIAVQPSVPPVSGITAQLVVVKVGKKRKLAIDVFDAGTGARIEEIPSPFQKPRFKAIQVSVSGNQVVVTARKGKRTVTQTFAG
jgi:hypothetical protein